MAVKIEMSVHDLHILRMGHGPDRVSVEMVMNGFLTSADCYKIWPTAFRGSMPIALQVLREAGYASANLVSDCDVTM